MRKLFLVVGLVVAIGAWLAVPAFACFYESPVVCAPATYSTPGGNQANAPFPTQKAHLPNNQGTQNATNQSPAIQNGSCSFN